MSEQQLRRQIRQLLSETVNNFLDKEEETSTKKLTNPSPKPQVLGDPISDVEMNQLADEQGSDGTNAPTVAVKAGSTKSGTDFTAGKHKSSFQDKTTLAK
jgi:hypothetical protein